MATEGAMVIVTGESADVITAVLDGGRVEEAVNLATVGLLVGHSYAPHRCPDPIDDRSGQSTRRLLLRRAIMTQTASIW